MTSIYIWSPYLNNKLWELQQLTTLSLNNLFLSGKITLSNIILLRRIQHYTIGYVVASLVFPTSSFLSEGSTSNSVPFRIYGFANIFYKASISASSMLLEGVSSAIYLVEVGSFSIGLFP